MIVLKTFKKGELTVGGCEGSHVLGEGKLVAGGKTHGGWVALLLRHSKFDCWWEYA